MPLRLFEVHEQPWFPQFLRDQFVDGLQMIQEVTNTYRPIAPLLRKQLDERGSDRVVDLCSGAGGPWPSLVRHFKTNGVRLPEVFLTDKYPCTRKSDDWDSPASNRIHFLRYSVDATQVPGHLGDSDRFSPAICSMYNPPISRGSMASSISRRPFET